MKDRVQFQASLTSALCDTRIDNFQKELPFLGFIYLDLKLNPQIDIIKIDNKVVTKLRLFRAVEAVGDACLYIKYEDGTKAIKSVKTESTLQLEHLFECNKASRKITFARMSTQALPWKFMSVERIYSENTKHNHNPNVTYKKLDIQILEAILNITKQMKITQFNCVEGGCGTGRALKFIESEFFKLNHKEEKPLFSVNYLGFDYNEVNIRTCNLDNMGSCNFIEGDLLNIDRLLSDNVKNKKINDQWPTILILCGSLTRLVLDDGFIALEVLQKTALSKVDYIIGGGVGEPLINDFIAKRVGYKKVSITDIETDSSGKFFSYQRLSLEEILQNKVNKIKKQGLLDLSMSPNPEVLLPLLKNNFIDGLTIDLSFCNMSNELIGTLEKILTEFPTIKLLFWHWDNHSIEKFASHFASLTDIAVNQVKKDGYLMAPRSLFSYLHPGNKASDQFLLFSKKRNEEKSESALNKLDRNFNSYLSNDLIYQYFCLAIGLKYDSHSVKMQMQSHVQSYLDAHLGATSYIESDHDISKVMSLDKKLIDAYISTVKEKVKQGDMNFLPELIYIFQNGIERELELNQSELGCFQSLRCYNIGRNLSDEIELYFSVAQKHPATFHPEAMKKIVEWRIAVEHSNVRNPFVEKSCSLV